MIIVPTELRTTDLSIQPENIIIGQVDENVVFPDWMTLGNGLYALIIKSTT